MKRVRGLRPELMIVHRPRTDVKRARRLKPDLKRGLRCKRNLGLNYSYFRILKKEIQDSLVTVSMVKLSHPFRIW